MEGFYLQAVITALNVIVCAIGVFSSHSLFTIYWPISVFMTAPILLDYYLGEYPKEAVALANLFSLFFNIIFLITQLAFFGRKNDPAIVIDDKDHRRLSSICVSLGVLGVLFFILAMPSYTGMLTMDWNELAASVSGIKTVFINLANIFIILSTALIIPTLLTKKYKFRLLIVFACWLMIAMLSRVKAYTSVVALPFLIYIGIRGINLPRVKYAFRLLLCSLLFPLLYLTVSMMRWLGPLTDLYTKSADMDVSPLSTAGDHLETSLRSTYYLVTNYFMHHSPLDGATYTRFFLYPLSRIFNIESPENPIYFYYDIVADIGPGIAIMKGSEHPTLYGDCYANFHFFGLLLAVFYAMLLWVSWAIGTKNQSFLLWAFISLYSFGLPLIMRGSVFYGLYGLISGAFIAIIINFLFYVLPKTLASSKQLNR